MRVQLLALVAMGLLLGAPLLTAAPTSPSDEAPHAAHGDAAPALLFLDAGTFDPATDAAPGPSALHMRSTHPYYVLQFDGPVQKAWRDAANEAGAELLGYLPNWGYFARVGASDLDAVRALDHLRYLGPAHPAYRIDPALWDAGAEVRDIELVSFDGTGASRIAQAVADRGGAVLFAELDHVTARMSASLAVVLVRETGLGVQWAEPRYWPEPLLDNDARIARARQSVDGAYANSGQSMWSYNATLDRFEGWTGRNVTIAVDDSGLDDSHPGFATRLVQYYDYDGNGQRDNDGHGTHVAGIVLGDGSWRAVDASGVDGKYAGFAPQAGMVVQEIFSTFYGVSTIARDASRAGASINTNSWGGGEAGAYYSICQEYDDATRDSDGFKAGNQQMLFTFSAGNAGWYGAYTVFPPATAKNVITVGATGNDKYGSGSDYVAGFSSRGPTQDGRMKPDVVIPGDYIASARSMDSGACQGWSSPSDGGQSYILASGTSMASPGVAGSAAVITQYLVEQKGFTPSPALIKASLINGARILAAHSYPGNTQGWGAVDLAHTLFETETYTIYRDDQRVRLDTEPGTDTETYFFMVKDDEPLKLSLVWTDPGGVASGSKDLINDLDLEVRAPDGAVYYGNAFSNGESLSAALGGMPDRTNNVEGAYLRMPQRGVWTVKVKAHNVPQGPQDYALVVSGNVVKGHVDLLTSAMSVDPVSAEEHHPATLSVHLSNPGNRASGLFDYRVDHVLPDGTTEVLAAANITDLDAGAGQDLSWGFSGPRGTHTLRVTLDPAELVPESNETNNVRELQYFFAGYDALLSVDHAELRPYPSQLVEFNVTVGNGGNVIDDFSVALSAAPPGWNARLIAADTFTLDPAASTVLPVGLIPPSNATADERAVLVFTATPLGNSSRARSITLVAVVDQVFDMGMAALVDRLELLPGANGTLQLVILNPGNGPDTYELQPPQGLAPGWWVKLPELTVDVPHRSQATVPVVLFAPDPAPAGSTTDFTVVARSLRSGLSRSVALSAILLQFYDTVLTATHREHDADVGTTVKVGLLVKNGGNGQVDYVFDLLAPSSEWAMRTDPGGLRAPGYSSGEAELSFTVPLLARNQSYELSVAAIPSGGPVVYHNFTFSARQFHALALSTASSTPTVTQGSRATVAFRVENRGNGVEQVRLLASSLPGTWTAVIPDGTRDLAPFETVDVPVGFDTSRDTPRGTYRVTILARFGYDETVNATAEVRVVTRPDLLIEPGSFMVNAINPAVGNVVQFNLTIFNAGDTAATDVFVQFLVDNYALGQPQYLSSLGPGERQSFLVSWLTNTSGTHLAQVIIDPLRGVDETNEANNGGYLTVDVEDVKYRTTPSVPVPLVALALVAIAALVVVGRARAGSHGG